MAARIETNSFQSKSRQADPSHWLNRATFCMVHSMIFIVLLNCMFFDDNWMPCGCFLVWNCSPKDFLPWLSKTASASKTGGPLRTWEPTDEPEPAAEESLGVPEGGARDFLGNLPWIYCWGPGITCWYPCWYTRWVDMGCLLRLSVKMLLDGLKDRRTMRNLWFG